MEAPTHEDKITPPQSWDELRTQMQAQLEALRYQAEMLRDQINQTQGALTLVNQLEKSGANIAVFAGVQEEAKAA